MHFATLTALALALVGATNAKPTIAKHSGLGSPKASGVSVASSFPVSDLDAAQAKVKADTTLNTNGGLRIDITAADFPADLLLCESVNCANCFEFDLSVLPHQTCLTANFDFVSVAISQPSNSGLDFGVFVGPPGCASFGQIPVVNECFNVNGGPFSDFALVD